MLVAAGLVVGAIGELFADRHDIHCHFHAHREQQDHDAADRVAESISEQHSPHAVDVVWHAGEPLATPLGYFRSLLAPFEALRANAQVQHHVQTNATLINDAWCELFTGYSLRVGISVDGPAAANRRRVDLAGRQTFGRVIRGIETLRRHEIEFDAICVVTRETINDGRGLVAFFAELGCRSVGFNIEEQEGVATGRRPVSMQDATVFWRDVLTFATDVGVVVRELSQLARYLRGGLSPSSVEPIPTVAYTGDVVLLPPELAGFRSVEYGDFCAGNVLTSSIPAMLREADRLRYAAEFEEGLRRCAATCGYWDYCRGAQAGNRYFEDGSFAATETNFCRTTRQALVNAAADLVGERRPLQTTFS